MKVAGVNFNAKANKNAAPCLRQIRQGQNLLHLQQSRFLLAFALVVSLTSCVSSGDSSSSCNEPLSLDNARLFASSELSRDRSASEARELHSPSSWTAGQQDFSQYLIVDLGKKYNLTSLSTQGRAFSREYVTEFRVDYGFDGKDFAPYRDKNGNIRIFDGNTNDKGVSASIFDTPLVAQYLRINPTRWHDRISMRVSVSGCEFSTWLLGFNGQSMILQNLRRQPIDAFQDRVQFRFRTLQADGSILFATSDSGDSIAIQLVSNKLTYSVNLGSGKVQTVTASSLLDDNIWHDVSIDRRGKSLVMSVDRVVVRATLDGDFSRLNLNTDLWIGGLPAQMSQVNNNLLPTQNSNVAPSIQGALETLQTSANFSGCIENLLINGTNVAVELKDDYNNYLYQTFGYIYHFCTQEPMQTITFTSNESYFSIEGYQLPVMNCSLSFRTFVEDGILLYSKFSVGESITLELRDGKLVATVQGEQGPQVSIDPSDSQRVNDGSWHSVQAVLRENLITILVDSETSITRRMFRFQSGRDYFIGGKPNPSSSTQAGFVGCMRNIHIEGRYVSLASVPAERMHKADARDIIPDSCQMIDLCHPNPCQHNGVCKQTQSSFSCDCGSTGYIGAVCHISKHPPSCASYKIENPKEKEKNILIDVDGSGPLGPVQVTCKFAPNDGPTQTIIHYQNEDETLVQGYEGKGSFKKTIDYNASLVSIRRIIERSNSCSQYIRYTCLNARLLNTGSNSLLPATASMRGETAQTVNEPFSYWLSHDNQKMDYWGGALPGSGSCACGLDSSCKDPYKACNCDSQLSAGGATELTDDGLITQADYLPVREVHVGDTGAYISNHKYAKVFVGPLVCEGGSSFNEAMTFRKDDASIEFPNVVFGESSDIYLQFKTTASSAVLLSGKGLNETIKLSIISEKTIQFLHSSVKDSQPLSVEAAYRFNDNNWHSVTIERNKKETRLVVDGQMNAHMRTTSHLWQPIPVMSQLLIGATEDFREGFVGCVRNFLIDGQIMDLTKQAEHRMYGLQVGCHGKCEQNPCLNKGLCKEAYSSYVCDCQYTAFKGPICADEIGVNLRSDNYIRYDFDTSLSTVEETIRVGFTTNDHKGLLLGVTSNTGEYLNLLMSTSGHLKLEFDFGFERKEEVLSQENFALGQHHDLTIKRIADGSRLVVTVDNYEPLVYVYKISKNADVKFDQLKSIYIGRNETMDSGDGFVGCVSHVSFDDNFPLRALFQEVKRPNVHAFPPDDSVREDACGIEPIRPPPERPEQRPLLFSGLAPGPAAPSSFFAVEDVTNCAWRCCGGSAACRRRDLLARQVAGKRRLRNEGGHRQQGGARPRHGRRARRDRTARRQKDGVLHLIGEQI